MTSSPNRNLKVLGIESSCDDTSAAIVELNGMNGKILSNIVEGQNTLHQEFGGVVPEIAARAHAERLDIVTQQTRDFKDVDLIAVTSGPGLIGGLNAANAFARALALALKKPLIGVNHLAGHALTPCLSHNLKPPFLLLLVSGGHCQFLIIEDYVTFSRIGSTIDDSPGEAFDKIAKILGLGYPGGPLVEEEAKHGNPDAYSLPRPLLNQNNCDFSFSGLKTATRRVVDQFIENGGVTKKERANLCASFQKTVGEILTKKSERALEIFMSRFPGRQAQFAIAGGVASNMTIRAHLDQMLSHHQINLVSPPLSLCTDNAAMIAFAGGIKYNAEGINPDELLTRPRWPIDQNAQPVFGFGKKGAKA